MDRVMGASYINYVEEYINYDGKWVSGSCRLPINPSLFTISRGSCMDEPAIIVTLIPSGSLPVKVYWRADGVLLVVEQGAKL